MSRPLRMARADRVSIRHEHVNLLAVTGRLDPAGLVELQKQLDLLLDRGARFVVLDLVRAAPHDGRLPDLVVRTAGLLRSRDGWLRVLGPGSAPLTTVEATAEADVAERA